MYMYVISLNYFLFIIMGTCIFSNDRSILYLSYCETDTPLEERCIRIDIY